MSTYTSIPSIPGLARARTARGFTLIEAVMVMVLMGILAAVGAPMIANGMRIAVMANTDLNTISQLRYATERLTRELREIRSVGGVYAIDMTTNAFTKTDGTTVTIGYTSPNVTINGFTLTNQATGVTPFQLTYLAIDGVTPATTSTLRFVDVLLRLTNSTTGASHTQRTRVAMRNTE